MRTLKLLLPMLALLCVFGSQPAEASWASHHPRRAYILHRDRHQVWLVNHLRHEHELTAGQAQRIRREERGIRHQEQIYARVYHGHISKAQERVLNHELNMERREIQQDVYKDAHR
jgi:hypothetical protein